MSLRHLWLFKQSHEFVHGSEIDQIPHQLRGIYVLYRSNAPRAERPKVAEVVYIGLARRGMKRRLMAHKKAKASNWTHASVFAVRDNISDEKIKELEGFLRHIYRKDSTANRLNAQRSFKPLRELDQNRGRRSS